MRFLITLILLLMCTMLASCSLSDPQKEEVEEAEVPDSYIPDYDKPLRDGRQKDLEDLSTLLRSEAFFSKLKAGYVYPYARNKEGSTLAVMSFVNETSEIKLTMLDCEHGEEGFTIKLPSEGDVISEQVIFQIEETLRTNELIEDAKVSHVKLSESFDGPDGRTYQFKMIDKWGGNYIIIEDINSRSSWLIGAVPIKETLTLTELSFDSSSKMLLALMEDGTSLYSYKVDFNSLVPEKRLARIDEIIRDYTKDGQMLNAFMRNDERAYIFATPSASAEELYTDWVIVSPSLDVHFFANSEGVWAGSGELISNKEENGYHFSLAIVNDNATDPPSMIVDQYVIGTGQLNKSFVFNWNTYLKLYEQVK